MQKKKLIKVLISAIVILQLVKGQGQVTINCNSTFDSTIFSSLNGQDVDFIFIGENHFNSFNPKFLFNLIKYAHDNKGIRNVVWEDGLSYTYMLNKYLCTGDAAFLDSTASVYFHNYYEYMDLFRDVFEYNQAYSENDKIRFIGVDLEFQHKYMSVVWFLKYAFKDLESDFGKMVYRKICSITTGLTEKDTENRKTELKNLAVFLLDTINSGFSFSKEIKLNVEKWALVQVLENSLTGMKDRHRSRDWFICQNFNRLDSLLGIGKAIGQIGAIHVGGYYKKHLSFAQMLKKQRPQKKIITGQIVYDNCYFLDYKYSRKPKKKHFKPQDASKKFLKHTGLSEKDFHEDFCIAYFGQKDVGYDGHNLLIFARGYPAISKIGNKN